MEGTFEDFLGQTPAQRRANFKIVSSGSVTAEFWKSPEREILETLWATCPSM